MVQRTKTICVTVGASTDTRDIVSRTSILASLYTYRVIFQNDADFCNAVRIVERAVGRPDDWTVDAP